jgi:hypothetical protein
MRKLWSVAVLSLLLLLIATPGAEATVTIGQLPAPDPAAACFNGPNDIYQSSLASGNTYVAPAAGVITSWSTEASSGAGQTLKMKVFRPLGGTSFLVVGQDGPRSLDPGVLNTFPTDIAVQPGDVIGLNDQNATAVSNACLTTTSEVGDAFAASSTGPDAANGATITMEPVEGGYRLNVSATLLEAPTITTVTPPAGASSGGTSVTIAGTEFAEVQSVRFGATAASYTVNSEVQITAAAPSASTGPVPVTVTTLAGTAISSQQFTYEAPTTPGPAPTPTPAPISAPAKTCTVPKLKGKSLKVARRAIIRADCNVGRVNKKKDLKAAGAKVVGQSSKPGSVLPARTAVNVTLGNG